ncbi:MAG TPA: NADH-quinone oxidoreductase subunit C [Gemmatimonadota bacterium]|nr:NADH-quinone oxidoreductase subunit C [Gemmatimonadota bacterium]
MAQFVADRIQHHFADAVQQVSDDHGDLTVWIERDRVHDALMFCKHDEKLAFNFCMDVTAVDYQALGAEPRFAVVYHLYSLSTGKRLRIKVGVSEDDPVVDTAVDVWKSTDWFEREVYDMFGIRFEGHPNMKRILTHQDFVGHPLRKDYPADLRWRSLRPDDLVDEISSEEMERIRGRIQRKLGD